MPLQSDRMWGATLRRGRLQRGRWHFLYSLAQLRIEAFCVNKEQQEPIVME